MKKLNAIEAGLMARALESTIHTNIGYLPLNGYLVYEGSISISRKDELKAAKSLEERGLMRSFGGGWVDGFRQPTYYKLTEAGFKFAGTTPKRLALAELADRIAAADNYPVEWPSTVVTPYNLAFFRQLYADPEFTPEQVTEHEISRIAQNRANYERDYNRLCLLAAQTALYAPDF